VNLKAVLTGDLIDSRAMRDPNAFIARLKTLLGELGAHFDAQAETFRGDGFQVVMRHAQDAFDCAVAIRAGLLAASAPGERWDARLALGISQDDTAAQPYSEAFVLSGRGLDGMKNGNTLHLQRRAPAPALHRVANGSRSYRTA